MSKIALLGDTHFGVSRSSPILHDHFSKFYAFFFSYLNKHNIKNLISLGDLFDQRKDVHFTTIKWANENFFKPIEQSGIQFYVIAGNHDTTYKNRNDVNSVSLLCPKSSVVVDLFPQTILIDDVTIDLFPWISPGNIKESMEFIKTSKSDIAIGHFEFSGFPMHPGSMATSGMNHKEFGKYAKVYSGHYHTISSSGNVQYTGTPCELTWSDWNDPKGFWVFDTETREAEFVRSPFTLFEKITYTDDIGYDFTEVNGKYVKVVVASKKSQKKFDEFLLNVNLNSPIDVRVIESSSAEAVQEAVDVTDLVSTRDMIADVIEQLDTELDKQLLKTKVLDLYTEAYELTKGL